MNPVSFTSAVCGKGVGMLNCHSLIRYVISLVMCAAFASHAADDFDKNIRPILAEFCVTCHSTQKQKGDLDLERFTSVTGVKKHPIVWEGVLEQLASNEMPPKDKPQLSADQKKQLTAWVQSTLDDIALANAGDPGPVVLRRLSNVEYTYTIRDLTGVPTLDPTREFPIDGAAGEGFTNAGAALVMSPALFTKYLDAAKDLSNHAVLTPSGIRFSAHTTSRDWTDETLEKIRAFYAQFSVTGGATSVNLQGVKFDTNAGGRLPVANYILAMTKERDALAQSKKSFADVATERGLNAKYLQILWSALNDTKPSLILDSLRAKWRDGKLAAADIEAWQQSLWRFASVGHIGKVNGPKGWQEPVTPLASQHEMRQKLAAPAGGGDVTLFLSIGDAGDGNTSDFAVWDNPRLVAPGRKDLSLKDVKPVAQSLVKRRDAVIASASKCLAAAAEAQNSKDRTNVPALAAKHSVDADVLAGWLDYLGVGTSGDVKLGTPLVKKSDGTPQFKFIKSWNGADAIGVIANSSDTAVRIPGNMKPHSIAVHPAPKVAVGVAWRSPIAGTVRISGGVQRAHPECGVGIVWSLEIRRGHTRERLADGEAKNAVPVDMGKFESVRVLPGDVVTVIIGPREGNHTCDLTALDLSIKDGATEWNLARDISPDILAGNPHADSHGNKDVWHFFGEPASTETPLAIPVGSLLASWRKSIDAAARQSFADKIQSLLQSGIDKEPAASPDRKLYTQLLAFNGPLLSSALRSITSAGETNGGASPYGVDPALFGKHPNGSAIDPKSICVQAPSVIEVRLPASIADGAEFVATGRLHPNTSAEGSVQMQVLTTKPETLSGIAAGKSESSIANGLWSANNLRTVNSAPVVVVDGSAARKRFESAFDDFRSLFPIALCYTKIVPVDEVVTLTLYYREDEQLRRLMLDDAQAAALDRMWDELLFVSDAPLKQVDVFEQLYQFATQDASPSAFEPMRTPIMEGAAAFKKRLVDVEPNHVQAVLDFAARAWRRPLSESEQITLRALYQTLRKQDLPHAAAVRMTLVRVLVASAFLYRQEITSPGTKATPVNDWELATRLSYFLWSSTPDDELNALAAKGQLHEPNVLAAQTQRMLKDAKVRRLGTEFGCQWLHVRDLETLDEKSERHFPTFVALRGSMQEEAVRFMTDLFQENRPILSLLDADFTYVNGDLAKHYGLTLKTEGWQRVDGLLAQGRGGILGFASTLAKQSGASRTSPILRGNWLSEVILGERLPRPPKGVPVLPEEAPHGLTERQLIEKHSSDAKCAVCHKRIDPFGFALEGFDAIGRARTKDAGGLLIDTRTTLANGTAIDGINGLRSYLLTTRRDDVVRQFCRKLLGFALGRSVQLSDKPLIETMLTQLKANEFRSNTAIELIIRSPQFRDVRGRDFAQEN